MPFPLHAQTMGFLDIFNSIPIYNKNMQLPFQNNSLQRIFTLPNLSLKKLKAFKTKISMLIFVSFMRHFSHDEVIIIMKIYSLCYLPILEPREDRHRC